MGRQRRMKINQDLTVLISFIRRHVCIFFPNQFSFSCFFSVQSPQTNDMFFFCFFLRKPTCQHFQAATKTVHIVSRCQKIILLKITGSRSSNIRFFFSKGATCIKSVASYFHQFGVQLVSGRLVSFLCVSISWSITGLSSGSVCVPSDHRLLYAQGLLLLYAYRSVGKEQTGSENLWGFFLYFLQDHVLGLKVR